MLEVLTRSRGTTAVQHWAEDFAERTLCARHLVEARLLAGATVTATKPCPSCAARRQDAVLRERAETERRARGVWNTRNRTTGKLQPILIADMADTHVVSALALLRRRAAEWGFGDHRRDSFLAGRWPGYPALCREAERRFGPVWESMVTARMIGPPTEDGTVPQQPGDGRKRAIRVREQE